MRRSRASSRPRLETVLRRGFRRLAESEFPVAESPVSDRFYAPGPYGASVIALSPDESQHLAGVLRKAPGDAVVIFDGCGNAADAVVESIGKRAAAVRIVQRLRGAVDPSPRIELASAVPKGDRARWLVEKSTELGAASWTPLHLTRSVVDPGTGKLDRLRQTVIAACKQCGRNDLLEIRAAREWKDWLAEATQRGIVLVTHPTGGPLSRLAGIERERMVPAEPPDYDGLVSEAARREPRPAELRTGFPGHIAIAIGPEGGFTDEEIDAALHAGALLVNLGPHILRIETAAIAALAWLRLMCALPRGASSQDIDGAADATRR